MQTALDRHIVLAAAALVAAPALETSEGLRVDCKDGWHAARLLLELGILDSELRPSVKRMAAALTGRTCRETMANVRSFVLGRVAFEREKGEIFVGPDQLLRQGFGDCDDHARLVFDLIRAAGVPSRLAFCHSPGEDPAHVCAQGYDPTAREWLWIETTINRPKAPGPALLGEHPRDAVVRMGLRRPDAVPWGMITMREGMGAAVPLNVTDDDLRDLAWRATNLGADPVWLLTVLYGESGMRPNPDPAVRSGHYGLNQVDPTYLPKLGWTAGASAYQQASILQQLPVVEAFFHPVAGQFKSAAGMYLWNASPAAFYRVGGGGDPSVHVYDAPSPEYNGNKGLDFGGKGYITVGDIGKHVARVESIAEFQDLKKRLQAVGPAAPASASSGAAAIGAAVVLAAAIAWIV